MATCVVEVMASGEFIKHGDQCAALNIGAATIWRGSHASPMPSRAAVCSGRLLLKVSCTWMAASVVLPYSTNSHFMDRPSEGLIFSAKQAFAADACNVAGAVLPAR